MGLVGLICGEHGRVGLDHFNKACSVVPADYAAAVVGDFAGKERGGVHVTSALGCPRRTAIEQQADVWLDPLANNAMLGGTAWHALVERYSTEPALCELEVAGKLDGIDVVGTVDRLLPPNGIGDWKTTSDFADKWLRQGGAKPEHVAQCSMYAELVQQTLGWRPTRGTIWYRMQKGILPLHFDIWPLSTTLAFHPFGGQYSVSQLLHHAAAGISVARWEELPLAGESQSFGSKSMCDYCAVRDTCYKQAKGAPF